jgi:two-component system NarL family sensor kinase
VTPGALRSHTGAVPLTRVLAALLAGLAVALVVLAWVVALWLHWSWSLALDAFVVTNGVMALSFGMCGGILAWHRPTNPIGWLFVGGGLLQAVAACVPPVGDACSRPVRRRRRCDCW